MANGSFWAAPEAGCRCATRPRWLRQALAGHPATIICLAASADGRYLASGSADQAVKLWDAATGLECATLRGHPSHVWSVAFSPDGERLVSGCCMRTIKMWSTLNGQACCRCPATLLR